MTLDPWYKVVVPREEVRKGRSFSPDEFAIAFEEVVAGTAPPDYSDPAQFFARTCFTRALREHTGMVLRRLAGHTANTAPVLTLVTQFGGGKTHTLTVLYHLTHKAQQADDWPGIPDLLRETGLSAIPAARVAVFVGNAWDPLPGRETPWIDIARQLAGDEGVAALPTDAATKAPGTDSIRRLFQAAGGPVLILFDEVLNFVNRHRDMADGFYAFLQNLTVATTGAQNSAAVFSLPRSQVEMTDWDLQWQERITKAIKRVAKDLIANDESEIAEVVRRRLFEDLGDARIRRRVANAYADWCFQRRAQLPAEWMRVDTASTELKAREFLRNRFEGSYPFHPATLLVFQRKWQALPQFQQTRSTLAMLAQWICWAYRDAFATARREPLITLGSAPLQIPDFCSVVLGQLGESRLSTAIDADIAGELAQARALDADTEGFLRDIHRRVGTAIFFESTGGQVNKVAHLPELRFALGEPNVDTTSIDTAAMALESKAFFMRKVGSDGFQIRHQYTLKKVVNDRLASLDEETDIQPQLERLIKSEFERDRSVPIFYFPADGAEVPDTPQLTLVVMPSTAQWGANDNLRQQLAAWTRQRGESFRFYPAALIWCLKKPGRDLRAHVGNWLAWRHVQRDARDGTLGEDIDRAELADLQGHVADAQQTATDEVWASYRYIVLADAQEPDGLRVIDLGAGHASAGDSLTGRVMAALKSQALLNETVGAGYIDRNWPPALKEGGAWPLASLRQSFLDGALTRLLDPDTVLRSQITSFVAKGDFGLASGHRPDGSYDRVWYAQPIAPEEVTFESDVFLLTESRAQQLKTEPVPSGLPEPTQPPEPLEPTQPPVEPATSPTPQAAVLRLTGTLPPELWNRLGTKVIPKLRSGTGLKVNLDLAVTLDAQVADSLAGELHQILQDLDISDTMTVETG